ncbi:hypothetical protein EIN_124450 [Entamoeba invadens IP1]|uniref:ATP-dependent DNA helicase n=1 Tax=Entamoeba invadens IP1 TaxID=370355 RepID=L7FLD6_ENTIV|nr:hypothetical protein EIN_124450 [Entamoeba invadens IP1]ELP83984.1 hypothetical protein EIN_124450 [Entamoeba invadens IP1]|eukprot:XP_004183330.1 hypothetical protein EIN_124450 [Entamoeba invadens IP1]
MVQKRVLMAIDKYSQDVMGNNMPFGGKVVVLGGDFLQTLPVVPFGSNAEIIDCCVKKSYIWKEFKKLRLTTITKSEGQIKFNKWLLSIGNGELVDVEIPKKHVES